MKRISCILGLAISVAIHVTSSPTPGVVNKQNDVNVKVDRQSFDQIPGQQQQFEEFIGSHKENVQQRNIRPAGCPAGFVYLRSVNGCYKVVTDPLQWVLAGVRCRNLHSNAHLLIVNNAEEQRAVVDELVKWYSGCTTGLWMAGQRLDLSILDEFVWKVVNTAEYPSVRIEEMTYTHWAPGEPSNSVAAHGCVHMWKTHNYAWDDLGCTYRNCAVCEIDM